MKASVRVTWTAAVLTAIVGSASEEPVWDGGGTDAKLTTKENWEGDVLPALTDGSASPLFASAGFEALADIGCFFDGLAFGGASAAFEFSGTGEVSVGAGGITVADDHAAVVSAPLVLRDAQTWSVGTDATLILSNAVSELDAACAVTKTGAGSLVLTKANAISGGMAINAGLVEVRSSESPFGTTMTEAGRTIVDENSGRAKLHLYDTVLNNQLYVKGGNEKGLFQFHGATNILNGNVVARNQVWRPTIYDGGTVIFNGTFDANNYVVPTASPDNTPTKCVFNGALKITERYTVGPYHTMVLAASDNEINWIELQGQAPTIVFDADYVSRGGKVGINACQNANWNSRIYLNGHDQEFGRLWLQNNSGQWLCEMSSSSPADISFNQTIDATCSDFYFKGQINLKKTGPNLFAVACAMTATGKLEVAEGVFAIRSNGSWVNATTVTSSGTGTNVIENAAAFSKNVDLVVADTGVFSIADNLNVSCNRLTVNGIVMEEGTYGGANSEAEHKLDCFDATKTGIVTVSEVVPSDPVLCTWTAAASSTSISAAQNWDDGRLPSLKKGYYWPLFADAGSQALIDIDCYFYGLKFGGDVSAFELTGAKSVSIGAGGIAVADEHAAVISAPLVLKDVQTWSVGTDATLILSNSVSDFNAACTVTKTGAGSLVLTKANAISGGMAINAGLVEVRSSESPFGTTLTDAGRVTFAESNAKLDLYGTVLNNQLYVSSGGWDLRDRCRFYGATNVLNGTLFVRSHAWYPTIYDGGTVVLNGAVDANQYIVPNGASEANPTKCVFNGPVKCTERYTVGAYHTMVLAASDNEIGWIELQGQAPTVEFDADYVSRGGKVGINAQAQANWNSRIHLNGHAQEFGSLALTKVAGQWLCEMDSSAPADISFDQKVDATCTDFYFAGQINLKKTGANLFAVACAMTATGKLEVAEGVFAIRSNGSWVNATNVTASGTGTFVIENEKAFAKKATVCVSESGCLRISDGKKVRCGEFFVEGVKQTPGTYGGANSSAMHKLACFDDDATGVLDVRGGGIVLIVR